MASNVSSSIYEPKLFGFRHLFYGDTAGASKKRPLGFAATSTILLIGPPGSGKTTFAFACARDLLFSYCLGGTRPGEGIPASAPPLDSLYYISLEVPKERLARMFPDMGWFTDDGGPSGDMLFGQRVKPEYIVPEIREDRPPLTPEETVNWVLNQIRERRRAARTGERATKGGSVDASKAIVIVDSLNALFKDCADRGEARRQTHEFIHRVKAAFGGDGLALSFFIAEEAEEALGQVPVTEYVLDYAFRFDAQDTGGNRKLRTFEVIKSQGAPMRIGKHTWAIISLFSVGQVFTQPSIHRLLKQLATQEDQWRKTPPSARPKELGERAWGTVAIFPRTSLPAIGMRDQVLERDQISIPSGIPGLDEMLELRENYWARAALYPDEPSSEKAVIVGTTTLVMGEAGTGKTTMSLQFLLAAKREDGTAEDVLYVNFENSFDHVLKLYPGDPKPLTDRLDSAPPTFHHIHRRRGNLDLNVLIAEIRFLLEQYAITRVAVDGLASLLATGVPNEHTPLAETLLTAIRGKPHGRSGKWQPPTVMVTYERTVDSGEQYGVVVHLSGVADNVVILRQIALANERRTSIEIEKARKLNHDRTAREVRVRRGHEKPLRILPGFEGYAGIVENKPELVTVFLQLFAENAAEVKFNRWLKDRLTQLFEYKVELLGFSRDSITRTLHDLQSPGSRIPSADVRILSVDEWWIRDHPAKKHPLLWLAAYEPPPQFQLNNKNAEPASPASAPLTTSPADFWWLEIEKACLVTHTEESEPLTSSPSLNQRKKTGTPERVAESHLLALPCYMDFGLFCVNLTIAQRLSAKLPPKLKNCLPPASDFRLPAEDSRRQSASESGSTAPSESEQEFVKRREAKRLWESWLKELPRIWARRAPVIFKGDKLGWFDSRPDRKSKQPESISEFCARLRSKARPSDDGQRIYGFAFDMEIQETAMCAFLEFAWSFGADEDFLIPHAAEYPAEQSVDRQAAFLEPLPETEALRFLMFLVAEGIMPAAPTMDDARRALFSRQYYSSVVRQIRGETPSEEQSNMSPSCENTPQKRGEASDDGEPRVKLPEANLLVLPFFPIGTFEGTTSRAGQLPTVIPLPLVKALTDSLKRLRRLNRRVLAAALSRNNASPGKKLSKSIHDLYDIKCELDAEVKRVAKTNDFDFVAALRKAGRWGVSIWKIVHAKPIAELLNQFSLPSMKEVQTRLRQVADASTYSGIQSDELMADVSGVMSLDARDVSEILSWHQMRIDLLWRQLAGEHIGEDVLDAPQLPVERPATARGMSEATALTGYPCMGSWMVGLYRKTQSPGLSAKLLEEITSLESAKKRARMGAGLPSRKDFYEFCGDQPVACAEHLTWKQLYRACGSRARRRERTVCSYVPVSRVSEIIHHELQRSLRFAALHRNKPGRLAVEARDAIGRILKEIRQAMQCELKRHAHVCVDCPQPTSCKRFLGREKTVSANPRPTIPKSKSLHKGAT